MWKWPREFEILDKEREVNDKEIDLTYRFKIRTINDTLII